MENGGYYVRTFKGREAAECQLIGEDDIVDMVVGMVEVLRIDYLTIGRSVKRWKVPLPKN